MSTYTDTKVNSLVINTMPKAVFDSLENASDTELYYVTDETSFLMPNDLKTINGMSLIGIGDITVSAIDDTALSITSTYSSSKIDSTYAKKTDIPSLTGYARTEYVDTQLSNKQDRLTAGTGITIIGNTISSYAVGIDDAAVSESSTYSSSKIDTTYAKKEYVDTKVSDLVNSAPETLDTLKELSDALGGDANFATTVATQIGNKQDKLTAGNGITITGNVISSTATGPSSSVTIRTWGA